MKTGLLFFVLLVFGITLNAQGLDSTSVATSSEKSKIDGSWKGVVSSPQGEIELTFTFIVEGEKLTGKNSSAMGEIDLSNGLVSGNDFSFDVDLQGMIIKHKCKYLEDDSIDVKVEMMDQEIVMKLVRASK